VVWQAAAGAQPVISGASQVTGWTQVGSSGVWSAPVAAGSNSRQLYVNGQEAPVAMASPARLGFSGSWSGSSTGYSISSDSAALAWFGSLSASQVAEVEFDYPGGNGAWTESRCRVASFSASAKTLTMTQPCWTDVTARSSFAQGAGTPAAPVHDITFSGLQFSYATWNAPSTSSGFADVQSNLRMTGATTRACATSPLLREAGRGGR
jgi:hypothetical protein